MEGKSISHLHPRLFLEFDGAHICYGLKYAPSNSYVEILISLPQSVTDFGDGGLQRGD